MSLRYLILIIFAFIFFEEVQASFAKVMLVKGQVSYLGPGMKGPLWVTQGMTFKEDTSIVTRARGFVKIRVLDDGSTISLGPDSKIVVTKIKSEKGSVVSLLNGQIRSKVEKSHDLAPNESKLYIKTRTAALGVRGTEFITIANQENHVTSLITLEGEVAMNKIDTSVPITNIEKTVREALDMTEQVTLVKKGNTSTSYLHKEELTPPVKVNPVQLIALKKNEELTTAPIKSQELVKISQGKISEELKRELYAPDSAGKIEDVPTNGGIVDLKSAIFIPEIKNSNIKIGSVDANTGEFIPVEGIKLDERKGFVVAMANADGELRKKAKELNSIVEYKEVPTNFAPGHDSGAPQIQGNNFTMDKKTHELASMIGLSEFKYDGRNNESSTVSALKFGFEYTYTRPWSETLNLLTSIGGRFIGLDTKDYETDENKDLDSENFGPRLSIGFLYKIQQDISFLSKFFYEHELLPLLASNGSFESIGLVTRPAKVTGLEFSSKISYSEKVNFLLSYKTRFPANSDEIKLASSSGYSLTSFYQLSSFSKHKLSLSFERNFYDYNGQTASNTSILLGHSYKF